MCRGIKWGEDKIVQLVLLLRVTQGTGYFLIPNVEQPLVVSVVEEPKVVHLKKWDAFVKPFVREEEGPEDETGHAVVVACRYFFSQESTALSRANPAFRRVSR